MKEEAVKRTVRKVNRTIKGPTKIKAAFVRDVVSGKDFTASHPVHQEIRAVYQQEARKR